MNDEQQIRELVSRWHAATKAGDTDAVLSLMTDDALFLTSERPPMDKAQFAEVSRAAKSAVRPQIEVQQEILELVVDQGLAFMRSDIEIKITPPQGPIVERSCQTLTIFRKEHGRWLLARDANMTVSRK